MSVHSEGTLTFLFTDIEGSTRRWEDDAEGMREALAAHDAVLIEAIENRGGRAFKHTGDGMAASFTSANQAVEAAIDAQRLLGLPVRMGLNTGEAEARSGDFFGPTVNRVARVMGAGHGGQILVTRATAQLLQGFELIDLGEHLLRDVAEHIGILQVAADGLATEFAPLKTAERPTGNLPRTKDTFVGRDRELAELSELVARRRLITLTGFGGIGKTRLALELAASRVAEFGDGVWLVELAPVLEPDRVADAIATTLGITPSAGVSVAEGIASSLVGRDLLLVLDNCEHLLDAVAELIEQFLSASESVTIIATSREGLRVSGEQLYPVPALDVAVGPDSPAVRLFVDRARALDADFVLDSSDDQRAVEEICERLDGIALAIELAAARMVSMSPTDVRDRLDDRFRFLSASDRVLEHHQTLLGVVQWSYDLLEDAERDLLNRCSVFADGFALEAAHRVCGAGQDEYSVLDILDSLVRKSLLTTERSGKQVRFGLLETIRQYAADQLAESDLDGQARDQHAAFFADAVLEQWTVWDGPAQRRTLDWVDSEFSNLRRAFRWATSRNDIEQAATIASHTAMLTFVLQRFEPVGWAEETLASAEAAAIPQLARLYTAASICGITGRPQQAIAYGARARELEQLQGADPHEHGWAAFWEAIGHRYNGDIDRWLEICDALVGQGPLANLIGLAGRMSVLPGIGRAVEAQEFAEEAIDAARARQNPFWIAYTLTSSARSISESDPARALTILLENLDYSRRQRLEYFEAILAREIAGLEESAGDRIGALDLFDSAIESLHRAGNHGSVATTLADLAVFFKRLDRPEIAAMIYGSSTRQSVSLVTVMPEILEQLRETLGDDVLDANIATGEAMDFNEAMQFARRQIKQVRSALTEPNQ